MRFLCFHGFRMPSWMAYGLIISLLLINEMINSVNGVSATMVTPKYMCRHKTNYNRYGVVVSYSTTGDAEIPWGVENMLTLEEKELPSPTAFVKVEELDNRLAYGIRGDIRSVMFNVTYDEWPKCGLSEFSIEYSYLVNSMTSFLTWQLNGTFFSVEWFTRGFACCNDQCQYLAENMTCQKFTESPNIRNIQYHPETRNMTILFQYHQMPWDVMAQMRIPREGDSTTEYQPEKKYKSLYPVNDVIHVGIEDGMAIWSQSFIMPPQPLFEQLVVCLNVNCEYDCVLYGNN